MVVRTGLDQLYDSETRWKQRSKKCVGHEMQ